MPTVDQMSHPERGTVFGSARGWRCRGLFYMIMTVTNDDNRCDMKKMEQKANAGPSPDASGQTDERRRYRRYTATVDVWFRELRPAGRDESMHLGESLNISHGGMFIKTNCFYRLGTMLQLKVDVLGADNEVRQLDIIGRVGWISFEESLPGMGVEFKDIDDEIRQALLAHTYRGELQVLGGESEE